MSGADEIRALANWVAGLGAPVTAGAALHAAADLVTATAAQQDPQDESAPLERYTGIPAADRAIADAAGLAVIAGHWAVREEQVLAAVVLLKKLVLALV